MWFAVRKWVPLKVCALRAMSFDQIPCVRVLPKNDTVGRQHFVEDVSRARPFLLLLVEKLLEEAGYIMSEFQSLFTL